MNHLDRLAPAFAGMIVAALVLAGLLYGAHQLAAAAESLSMAIGGRL